MGLIFAALTWRIKERHLFLRRHFNTLGPSQNILTFDRRIFHASVLNALEKDVGMRRQVVQFDSSPKLTSTLTQCVSFGSTPSSPFDNDRETELEEILTQFPLQRLNPRPTFFVIEINSERIHPFVRGKAYRR